MGDWASWDVNVVISYKICDNNSNDLRRCDAGIKNTVHIFIIGDFQLDENMRSYYILKYR